MMFDAAAAVTLQDAASTADAAHPPMFDTHATDTHATDAAAPSDAAPIDAAPANAEHHDVVAIEPAVDTGTPHDVIFIDTSVDDYRQLAAEWAGRGQIVLIDGTRDGIAQMQSALAGQSGIAAIHIVSHGSEGTLFLGTTKVDTGAIQGGLASALAQIGQSLGSGGDILIYGCDFAEGSAGAQALAAFAAATHADVAASTDTTGYAGRGGDWALEAHSGSIEARSLDSSDYVHTLDPNVPVPISVTADSLTVTNGAGVVVVDGTTGYGTDGRSPDVGVGAVAVWHGAATYNGQAVDLRATVVSISSGDVIRFNRPTGTGINGDDPTFLLRDLTAANDATVEIRWELVLAGTNTPLPADVRFTIADIDGIGGNPNTRESVSASTTGLAYYTRERTSDINFVSSLDTISASGTQNENTVANQPLSPQSAATFDWSHVSSFTLTYKLTTNTLTTQAQFYHDGDADFVYTDPVYVSVPRLDLDGNDSTATGNDAHFTFTEDGAGVPIVDADLVVSNPMDINSITGASVRLTNYQAGDSFTIGTLPANITATISAVSGGAQVITLSGLGSESDYAAALRAITFRNTSDTPSTTQRVIDISFSNDTLTSAVATSRIDVIPVNDAPIAVNDAVTTLEDTVVTFAVLGNDRDPDGDALTVIAATALHGAVIRNPNGTLTYMPSPNFNGSDTITYTISDGHGGTATATVTVTITPVNDAPVAVGTLPARSTTDAAAVSYATAGGFSDVDGDTLTYSATGLPAGLTINAATGVISGTINRSASQTGGGNYTVVVTARDPSNAATTQTFTIAVTNPVPTATNDSATTAEDTPVTIAVLANDSDPDGDPLTVTAASALHGTVVRNADGTLTYTPAANYNGSDTISYTISDGQGGTANATVAITITPVNDAPAAVGTLPARATTDAATVSYATAGAFTDIDGDTLTYSATGLPAGLTINAATGVISGTINRSASQTGGGNYTVVVTARDPSNAATTQTFTIAVTNPVPIATNDSATTAEDTPVTIAVLANDSDPDGDPLTVTAASALHGTVVRNADGTLTYTPAANYNGSDTISYTISDGQGGTANATVAITITPVNDAPTAVGTLPARATTDAATVSYATAGGFSDVDGDALTYSATGLPAGLTINAATGVISGTINRSASQTGGGNYTVVVTARDPSNAATTQTFTIAVTNPVPTAANDSATTAEDTPVTIVVLANDSDPDGDPLTVTAASALHGTVVRNADGTLTYTPVANYNGSDTISYTISDGQGGTANATVAITITPVNDAPTAVGTLPARATTDAAAVSYATAGGFTDIDGDALTYSATGLPAGLTINAATGVISGTINRSASQTGGGNYTVVVTARDPMNAATTQTFTIAVTNPVPTATNDSATTAEDTPVTIVVLANDSDPDGDPLTVTAASALHGTVVRNADGTLTYTPVANYNGSDTISYTISDGQGGTANATVAITITSVEDAPIATNDVATTAEDVPVTIAVLANDSEPDGDPLTVTAASALHGTVVRNADGTLTYTPVANYNGSDTISYTISDGHGGSASATVAITVTPVNDAPVAVGTLPGRSTTDAATVAYPTAGAFADIDDGTLLYAATGLPAGLTIDAATGIISGTVDRSASQANGGAYTVTVTARDPSNTFATQTFKITVANPGPTATNDSASTGEDVPVIIAVLGNDSDPDGDPLTVTSATALHGSVTINADGTLTYRPASNYNGTDTINYTISDGQGGTASAQVAVTIAPVNDAPDAVGTLPGQATTDAASVSYATAAAFTDVDGDVLNYSATGLPAGLSIDPVTGVISGTIDRSASQTGGGSYNVVVTARDPSNAAVSQNFTILVANPGPAAVDDIATTSEDTPVTIVVLGNDSDPDGDPLTVIGASAAHGSVTINADGTLTYRPDANYNGSDTIAYIISDGQGGSAMARVSVTITPVDDAPVAIGNLPTRATSDGATITYETSTGFGDLDGDILTYSATGLPAGLTIDSRSGTISGTIDRSASQANGGTYAIVVTATDPAGASAVQAFAITVANPAPIATDDTARTSEDTPVTIVVLGNDTDPDGDPLTVTGASALHGSVTINADGSLLYTPVANYNGSDTISYTVSDGQGGTATAQVVVTIDPVNDAPVAAGTLPALSPVDGATIAYPTAAAFTDVDGDVLTYSASGLPAGLTIDPTTGLISGTIDRSASQANGGSYAVVVTATDPAGASATQVLAITVSNPAPIARDDALAIHVDTPAIVAVLANDSDPDGDPLIVTSASAVSGTVTVLADGTLRYTPAAGFIGRDTVSYTISDGQGGTSSAVLVIDITDRAPVADPLPGIAAADGQAISLPLGAYFSDPDGDPLVFSATGLPPGLTIDPATGTIAGTIDRTASQAAGGVYDTVVTASDGHGGTVTSEFRWTIANPAPIASDDRATTSEDSPIVIVVLANDSDPDGDPLSVIAASADHGTVTINPDGTITYRPNADFNGTDQIRYTIADADGGRSSAIVAVVVTPVNDAPTTDGLAPRTTADGIAVSVPAAPAFGDPDGDTLSYTATGLPPGLTIDPATGIISGTITPGAVYGGPDGNGVYHAIITATDPSGATASAPFDWTISAAAPTARDDVATTPEDTAVSIFVLANDTDADGDALSVVAASANHGSVTIDGGTLIFTPDADFTGTATITYTVSDPAGNRATATVVVTVTPVNDAPRATPLPIEHSADGEAISLAVGGFFGDPDGDTLSFAATGLPAGLTIDPVTGEISGTIDRGASQAPGGVYHVTVTATDPSGATTSSSFDWTIVNPAPIAQDDAATTAEDQATSVVVLANDSDPDGDPLSVVEASAGHGSVTIGPDGTLLYTPNTDFNGTDVIIYTISDGNGGRATASVLVTVTPVNDAPISATTPPATIVDDGAALVIPAGDLFRDPDGDPLIYSATGLPPGLTIDPVTGQISGTLDGSASQANGGVYPVTVTASDSSGATATVTIEIRAVNPAPIAQDDTAQAQQDGPAIIIPVLANDSDPDGDPLQVIGAVAGNGTVTINPDGSLVYTPGPGFTGSDTISYTISDGEGGTATAIVTVTVDPVNQAPIVPGVDPVDTTGGRPVTVAVLPGIIDPNGDPVTVTGATTAIGMVVVNPDGTITFTPPLGFVGTTTIGYTVSDGLGGTTAGTIVVRVGPERTADIQQALRIGHVAFQDPTPSLATVHVTDGTIRNPLILIQAAENVRSLRSTMIGEQPVGDAVEAIRSLRGTSIDPDAPITAEVARLDALRDQRDAGDRLFDQRWGDFMVKGLTGFSTAADRNACIMVESVVRGGAIYLDVRDTAADTRAPIRSVDIRLANGRKADWITVDHRGMAIIERGANMDELHLVVRVTRTDGSTSATPILVQGQTGEVELDRKLTTRGHAAPLDLTLQTPNAAIQAEAARLASYFQ